MKERRETSRVPIRVLVNCLPPGVPQKRNGHENHGWEMWVRNIADDGVRLQWSQGWASSRCLHCMGSLAGRARPEQRIVSQCTPPEQLKKGQQVLLDGLVYNEKGSKPMKGRIQWTRAGRNGETFDIGVFITSPEHRSYFRTLEAV